MAVTLTKVGKTPGQTQFGLDTFTERYKCDATADVVLTDGSVPQKGDTHPDYAHMFVSDRYCVESGESTSALDLVYTGYLSSLPSSKHDSSLSVQSATSSKTNSGLVLTSPATLQYYSPSNVLTYFSYGAPGTTEADVPAIAPIPITLTTSDSTFSGSGITGSINSLFSLQTIATIESTEIIATRFWQNVARTGIFYSPFIFDLPAGPYLSLSVAGVGYVAGDTLTVSSGGESATVVVDSVGSVFGNAGGILTYHTTANTFTVAHTGLVASGGSPSTPAQFDVFIIT